MQAIRQHWHHPTKDNQGTTMMMNLTSLQQSNPKSPTYQFDY
jgi:hypothetical protein